MLSGAKHLGIFSSGMTAEQESEILRFAQNDNDIYVIFDR